MENRDVTKVLAYAREKRGIDLSGYRATFLMRRLLARLGHNHIGGVEAYLEFLERDPKEWIAFLENLSINVSEFFRDPEVFSSFEKNCLSELLHKTNVAARELKIWSCGCSCGEESYSLAILISEYLREKGITGSFKIYATDIDTGALVKARHGLYSRAALLNVKEDFLSRYFTFVPKIKHHLEEDAWQVNAPVRQCVAFEKRSVILDTPVSDCDAIFLRNVRIYFEGQKANAVLAEMHAALNNNGFLVLGKIETVGMKLRHLFKSVDAVNRIYKKINTH